MKKQVAVIGYGSQGRAIALNLRDSGYRVTVGLRPRSKSRRRARADGFDSITTIPKAVASTEAVCMAFPDHLHGKTFRESIAPHLSSGTALWFLHGLSVHFGLLVPSPDVDVILIAPHAPGPAVREKYLGDRSVSAFVAVAQDVSGHAEKTAKELAAGIGISRRRLMATTFAEEAIGDIFGEQAVLCGGLAMLIKSGFEALVEHGHDPDHAYLEVAYQLDLIVDLIKKHGIAGMFDRISVTAQVGSAETGRKLIDAGVKRRMARQYDRIASGRFARYLASLDEEELVRVRDRLRQLTVPALERVVRKLAR